jgi:hypothetical protein
LKCEMYSLPVFRLYQSFRDPSPMDGSKKPPSVSRISTPHVVPQPKKTNLEHAREVGG